MVRAVSRALKLRLNRRYFWIGFATLFGAVAILAEALPWLLNGGFLLPWVLLHAARLHDFGLRGIWGLIVITTFFAIAVALARLNPPTVAYGAAAIGAAVALASFSIWVGGKRGDAGENRFGPAPMGWSLGRAAA